MKSETAHTAAPGIPAAAVAGAHQQPLAVTRHPLRPSDQLVDAVRLQDLVLVARHVALVVDLDHHVAPALLQQPAAGLLHRAAHRGLVAQPLVLAEVEDAQHHHHAELVGAPQDPAQSPEMAAGLLRQCAVGRERRIVPRLGVGARQSAPHLGVGVCNLPLGEQPPEPLGAVVAERRPTLQVDGDRGQAVRAVERQAAHELVGCCDRRPSGPYPGSATGSAWPG